MSISGKEIFKWESYLGSLISGKDPFFEKIACMTLEYREYIALLEILKILDPNDKEFNKEIDTIFIPILQRLGQSQWNPDIITHLAMKMQSTEKVFEAL